MPHRTSTARRAVVASGSAAALVVGVLATAPGAIAAPVSAADLAQSKIAPAVSAALEADGSTTYWVRFAERADLTQASLMINWKARGAAVVHALKDTAKSSQREVRNYLDASGVTYEAFYATNAIYLESGTAAVANRLASFDNVSQILAPTTYELDEPVSRVAAGDTVQAPEWGVQNIKAPQVWATGNRGQGIVIANIDTGVQYNHPALKNQYRGKKSGGNYNWFDSSGSSSQPYDQNGHGTHTMGTMVGDDGGSNQIGVAPKAKWIAANGCRTCSDADLIESGQWMLAPTKLNGSAPKASKRPDIVNNSWGTTSPSDDPFMEDVILAWEASGIFGQWSNGNIGPNCHTSGSPGSRIATYSAGAYDINNVIASFSSRGPGQSGQIKPNISAPGVNVRSSVPTSSYAAYSGTSMASPHVAGAIGLLWSEVKTLRGDVDATRDLLDNTAIDVSNLSCGGTADDNNVYGEGRLDAQALVNAGLLAVE